MVLSSSYGLEIGLLKVGGVVEVEIVLGLLFVLVLTVTGLVFALEGDVFFAVALIISWWLLFLD